MNAFDYDAIVLGAGVNGLSAAYSLTNLLGSSKIDCSRSKVLLLEQYHFGHERGSSHGSSRIIRMFYDPQFYITMMFKAYEMWTELERQFGERLFLPCGLVTIAPPPYHLLNKVENTLRQFKVPCERWDMADLHTKYPQTFNFDDCDQCVFDPTAGILLADKCLLALKMCFERNGGSFRDVETVESIDAGDQFIRLSTNKANYTCRRLIITAGSWTNDVLAKIRSPSSVIHRLPLVVQQIDVCFWEARNHSSSNSGLSFPTFYDVREPRVYAMPAPEYTGMVKLCMSVGRVLHNVDDNDVRPDDEKVATLQSYIASHVPALVAQPAVTRTCRYSLSPDGDFIIDYLPGSRNIVVGAGFSGHGFKLGPVTGMLLAELALHSFSTFDVTPFRWSRFNNLP